MNQRIMVFCSDKINRILQYCQSIKNSRNKKTYLYIGIAGVFLLSLFVSAYFRHIQSMTAYAVKLEDKVLGIVRNEEDFYSAIEYIKAQMEEVFNQEVVISDEIEFAKVKAEDKDLTDFETVIKNVKAQLDVKVKSAAIKVNNKEIILVRDVDTAQEILDELKALYIEEGDNTYIKFGEEVEIVEMITEVGVIREKEDALQYIIKGTDEERIHKVAAGESTWAIARKYGLTIQDIIKANPGMNPDRLQIGQEISLVVPKPHISVVTKEYKVYTEPIPFETEYVTTSALYVGDSKITVQGIQGEKEVKAYIIKENGIEMDREILEETILSEPKTRVIARGTTPRPPTVATGTFTNPTRGRLTSGFGIRWGRRHEGIDIAASIGTPITAADAGKVSFAGPSGAYGNLVIIDHENGYQTYYAHCHQILVKKGQRVYKGEKIATVGNTGRSTGPHLHFEVRKNGVPVNPLNFVKY